VARIALGNSYHGFFLAPIPIRRITLSTSYDWVRVRKYVYPEPTATLLYIEEDP